LNIYCQDRVFRNIEAIIFDKDGTLADSHGFWHELAIKRANLISQSVPEIAPKIRESLLSAFGAGDSTLDRAGLMAVGSRGENEIAAAAYVAAAGKSWFEARKIVDRAFREADEVFDTPPIAPLFAGVIPLLQSLSQQGLKLGILSADTTAGVENFIRYHRLEAYIQLGMGSDREYSKPNPALFVAACEQLNVSPARTIAIGDARGDIDMAKAAKAAGAIAICWEGLGEGKIEGADATIDRLEGIKWQ
jgi:phosphoglycolate phosphatase